MEPYQTDLRNKNRGYMKLIVWQKAMELFELVWKITYVETKIDFKLRAQVADAAQSIAANISEGYGRRSVKEYIQFLSIALGSAVDVLGNPDHECDGRHTPQHRHYRRLRVKLPHGSVDAAQDDYRHLEEPIPHRAILTCCSSRQSPC